MAAYQPINMPTPQGLGGFADFLMQVAQQDRADNARRADLLLRQQGQASDIQHQRSQEENARAQLKVQQDQAAELIAAKKLKATQEMTAALDAGRPDLAQQIAKVHGIPLGETPLEQNPQRDPRNTLMRPSMEVSNPPPSPGGADFTDQGEVNAQFFQPSGTLSPRSPTYQVAGERYDPQQAREAMLARRSKEAEQARGAFGSLGGNYGDVAAALTLGSPKDAPIDISGLISKKMDVDAQRAAREAEREQQRTFTQEENAKYRDSPEQRDNRARVTATLGLEGRGRIADAVGGKGADQNTLAAVKYVDDTIQKAARSTGYVKLREADQMLATANAQLASESGSGEFGALMLLARAMRGGASTEFTAEEEKKRLSGFAGRLEGYYQQFKDGQYSPEQLASAQKEVDAGRALMSHLLDRSGQAMATTLREDPSLENLKGTANAKYKALMQGIGRGDAPPPFPGETNNVPALGSNVVKGGGTYAPPAQQQPQEQRPNRISVSGPLGAFQGGRGDSANNVGDAALPEDLEAEELGPVQAARAASRAQDKKRAETLLHKAPSVAEAEVRQRAIQAGSDPDRAVARARRIGLIQ